MDKKYVRKEGFKVIVLVINAGSSSLKYQLIDMDSNIVLGTGICEKIGLKDSFIKHTSGDADSVKISTYMPDHNVSMKEVINLLIDPKIGVIASLEEITAVGHRIVHGGEKFKGSVVIDDEVMKVIEECVEIAPLHNPPNIVGIKACQETIPGVPMVAVFDTAFHQSIPEHAFIYGLPYEYYEKYKVRRYGFHGTSHKYVSQRVAEVMNRPVEELKIVTCHLGNGSSICAIKNGRSVDTSMGFTPLEGVPMGTRSGSIDPALVKYLMEKENLTISEVDSLLNKQSGALGISGISSDFRDIEDAANAGNARCKLALDLFCYRVKQYIGSYAAAMGGLDAVVFTAGIGENSPELRAQIVEELAFMGIKIDMDKNACRGKEVNVSTLDATVQTFVIPTKEELMIAMDTVKVLG